MSEEPTKDFLSRRKALKILVSSAGVAVGLPRVGESSARNDAPLCHIAAAAPASTPYTPRFFSQPQARTIEALSEAIIPADAHSPGAKAARVWEFIDDLVADSKESTKSLWTQGLAAVDQLAERDYQKKFADCAEDQQIALLEKISQNEEKPSTLEERLFVAVKQATIDGYYTSRIGIHQDLEYQGNTALLDFPGCTHEEHKTGSAGKN